MGTVPKAEASPRLALALISRGSISILEDKSRYRRPSPRRKILAVTWTGRGNKGLICALFTGAFRNTADYSCSIQNAPDGNDSRSAVSLQYACYGPFRARKKAGGPAPSPLFVWVYVAKGQNTTILVLGYGVGEKSHSRADGIRFNFSP